jgi:hypothetical protein
MEAALNASVLVKKVKFALKEAMKAQRGAEV